MTVEITPSGSAKTTAQQLLEIAETDPRFRIDDVKTTTDGPLGLAFLVPDALYEAWEAKHLPEGPVEVAETTEADIPKQRGRGRGTRGAAGKEE